MVEYQVSQQPGQATRPDRILVRRIAANVTSTANANVAWINPEGGTVCARVRYYVTGSAGTGTINIGRSSDGTGSASGIATAGTLAAGIQEPAGITDGILLGPGGTGTNNSIVAEMSDTPTSTMGALTVEITYNLIAPV